MCHGSFCLTQPTESPHEPLMLPCGRIFSHAGGPCINAKGVGQEFRDSGEGYRPLGTQANAKGGLANIPANRP